MDKKQKHIDNLSEKGVESTWFKCEKCHEVENDYYFDSDTAAKFAYEDGWRATPNYIYCPDCASKYLKS